MIDATELADLWPAGDGYLLNHSAGLPPLDAAAALSEGLFGPWSTRDDQLWNHWLAAIDRYRGALARVINGQRALICPQENVSVALTRILGALPVKANRKRLLIAERAFPSLGFVLAAAQRSGFELVMLPRDEDSLDPDAWAQLLDDRVHCVVFTHVHSNSGDCHDIAPLCDLARRKGAVSIIDVAQSIGVRSVDAASWGADFIIGSCLKWLCGGSGAGFLWVAEDRLASCEPVDVGWFSHADPFEFDIHHFAYAEDALRFWGGTPSVAPALVAGHAIEKLLEIGLPRIEEHNRELGNRLCAAVAPEHLVSPPEASKRGGSVILHFGAEQEAVIERLRGADLKLDARREGLRLSPHFYNGDGDIDRVLACLP